MDCLWVTKNGFIVAILIALSGCSLVSTSPYDSSADKAITKLHKQTAEFFAEFTKAVDKPECDYSHHLPFYKNSKVSISSLLVRARAMAVVFQLRRLGTVAPISLSYPSSS